MINLTIPSGAHVLDTTRDISQKRKAVLRELFKQAIEREISAYLNLLSPDRRIPDWPRIIVRAALHDLEASTAAWVGKVLRVQDMRSEEYEAVIQELSKELADKGYDMARNPTKDGDGRSGENIIIIPRQAKGAERRP